MTRAKAALNLVLIVLLGSQWLVPSHIVVTARPAADPAHAAHTKDQPAPAQPQHSCSCCAQDGTPSAFHEDLCYVGCPALPSASADFSFYTPRLFLTFIEPHEKQILFLAPPFHPPTV
jgi:hypothetical protein